MATILRVYNKSRVAIGDLPECQGLTQQIVHNAVGVLSGTYPRTGKNADLLELPVAYLAVVEDGVVQPDWHVLEDDGEQTAGDPNGPIQFAARSVMSMLEWAVVFPQNHAGSTLSVNKLSPVHKFVKATPGKILRDLIERAKDRGGLDDLTYNFSATNDSEGNPWPKTYTITYTVGTDYLQIVNQMVEAGWISVRTQGFGFRAFVPGKMENDRPTIIYRGGKDTTAADRGRSRRTVRNVILGVGEGRNMHAVKDTDSIGTFGRREGLASDGRMTVDGSLTSLSTKALADQKYVKETYSLTVPVGDRGIPGEKIWRPNTDFYAGDYVYYTGRRQDSNDFQKLQVKSISFTWASAEAGASCVLEFNDLRAKWSVQANRRIKRVAVAATRPYVPNTGNPIILRVNQNPTLGRTYAAAPGSTTPSLNVAAMSFTAVPDVVNDDGSDAEVPDWFEYQWRYESDPVSSFSGVVVSDTADIEVGDLEPNRAIVLRVRSVIDGTPQLRSEWAELPAMVPDDTTPPAQPTAPSVASRLGTLTVGWDGLSTTGGSMPADFHLTEVHIGGADGFAPTAATRVADILTATGGQVVLADLPYGMTYVRLVAVDTSGNRSVPSVTVGVDVKPLVDVDLINVVLDGANLEPGSVPGSAIVDGSIGSTQIGNLSTAPKVGGVPVVVTATTPPGAPTAPTITGASVSAFESTFRAQATLGWTAPGTAPAGYEFQWKYATGDWSPVHRVDGAATSYVLRELTPGLTLSFRVRSYNNGAPPLVSGWLTSGTLVLPKDTTAPNKPSLPVVASRLGGVAVTWDGKDAATGAAMPADFARLEVHASTAATGYAPTAATLLGTIDSATGGQFTSGVLTYGSTYRVKTVAVDTTGNRSTASDEATVTVQAIVDTDLIGKVIDGAKIVDGTIGSTQIGPLTTAPVVGGVPLVTSAQLDTTAQQKADLAQATAIAAASTLTAFNRNPMFADWPAGNTLPTSWGSSWQVPVRETAIIRAGGVNAVRWNAVAATSAGASSTMTTDMPFGLEYITVEVDLYLAAGTLDGAGVLLDWQGMTPSRAFMPFAAELPGAVTGRWYRITKALRRPAGATGTQTAWTVYLFANWTAGAANGFTAAAKDLIVQRIALRPSTVEEQIATQTPTNLAAKAGIDYVTSRGTNLVTNGTGLLGTNENFSTFTADKVDTPGGAAVSFDTPLGSGATRSNDEFLPVDPTKKLRLSCLVKNKGTSTTDGYLYTGFIPYDAAKLAMDPGHYMYVPGTTTTLAADLKPGDTTITLTSAAGWYGAAGKFAGTKTHLRRAIFWDYVDPFGKAWPAETYSRNVTVTNYWGDGAIVGNVITLGTTYSGPLRPAGTKVSNGASGGTYIYAGALMNAVRAGQGWVSFAQSVEAKTVAQVNAEGNGASAGSGWPPGIGFVKFMVLPNRLANGTADPASKHSFALISFGDAAAAQADADAANYAANNITSTQITDGAISSPKIAANAVRAQHLVVADLANLAELDGVGTVTYGGWASSTPNASGWISRTGTRDNYFMLRNQKGPVPIKTGDRVRVTFEAYTTGPNISPQLYLFAYPGTAGVQAIGPQVAITDTGQSFTVEANITVDMSTRTTFLIGLQHTALATQDVFVRNVRAYRMGAGELIVDGGIVAGKLAVDSVLAANIKAGEVTAGKLAADSVLANNIKAGEVTSTKIATDAILANHIKAGAITAGKMVLSDFTNYFAGASWEDPAEYADWVFTGAGVTVDSTRAYIGTKSLRHDGTKVASAVSNNVIRVTPGTKFRVTFWAYRDAAWNGNGAGAAKLRFGDQTNAYITAVGYGAADLPAGVWTKREVRFDVPAGATSLIVSAGSDATAGNVWLDDLQMRRMDAAELIVDGGIVAGKLAADSVVAANIVAGSVTTAKLAALAVEADKIAANAITAGKIDANAVTAVTIAADAVLARNIKAGEVTAGKLAVDSVAATNIQSDAITTAKLAANAITADKIAAGAVTTSRLDVGALSDNWQPNGFMEEVSATDPNKPAGWALMWWQGNPATFGFDTTTPMQGSKSMTLVHGAATDATEASVPTAIIPVVEGEQFRFAGKYRASRTVAGKRVALRAWVSQTKADNGTIFNSPASLTTTVAQGDLTTAETSLAGVYTVPAGYKWLRLSLYHDMPSDGAGAYTITWDEVVLQKRVVSAVIADGAITTPKLAALAVEAGNIAANAITADKIDAGAITAVKIAGDAIDGKTITGATLRTAATGERITVEGGTDTTDNEIRFYAPSGAYGLMRTKVGAKGETTMHIIGPNGRASSYRSGGPGWERSTEVAFDGVNGVTITSAHAMTSTELINKTGTYAIGGQFNVDAYGAELAAGSILAATMRARVFKYTDSSTLASSNTTGALMGARGGRGTFTVPRSRQVLVTTAGQCRNTNSGQGAAIGFEIRDGATIGQGTILAAYTIDDAFVNFNAGYVRGSMQVVVDLPSSPGDTVNIQQVVQSTSGSADFAQGRVTVIPQM